MKKKYALVFFISLAAHWAAVAACYLISPAEGGFMAFITSRFTTAGDSPHYINIAQNFYAASGEDAKLIVFYPLYPMLMRLFSIGTGNFAVPGIIISQISFSAACVYIYALAEEEGGDGACAAALLCLYPFCVFSMGVFTEGLFLLLSVSCLYYTRRHSWIIAGLIGFLAALTRTQGIALAVPMVYELFQSREYKKWYSALFPALGFAVYLLLNKLVQGDFLAFVAHEAAAPWYQTTRWIADNLSQHYQMAESYPGLAFIIYYAQIALYFIFAGLILLGVKARVRGMYLAHGGAYLVMSYLSGWMISGGRYMLGCVAPFIVISLIKNPRARSFAAAISGALFAVITYLFMRGYAIM